MSKINFNFKRGLLVLCLIICVLFTISSIYAEDGDIGNETVSLSEEEVISQDIPQDELSYYEDDTLGAVEVYFDASATSDGDGSQLRPYKYLTSDRIVYGSNVYFADGFYDLTGSVNIYSSSAHKTTFYGGDYTVIRSTSSNQFDFTITPDSYLILNDLLFYGIHINNQGNLEANNVNFRNSVGFDSDFHPSLTYAYDVYDSSYGGVITCDTPNDKITTLTLNYCNFDNNNASSGGVIAAYRTIAQISNCNFYNSTANRFGGAIYASTSSLNITDTVFIKSKSKYGGAIYSENNDLLIHYSEFYLSQAYSFGGAIAADESYVVVMGSKFQNSTSQTDAGGAIYSTNGELYVDSSEFSIGRAYYGGAICNLRTDFCISNSQLIDNHANGFGGAIYNTYGNIIIENNYFERSSSEVSGGVLSNRLSTSLRLVDNVFSRSSSNAGQIWAIDGDKSTMNISGNKYKEVYEMACIYMGYLSGQRFTLDSNFLLFSVSNYDDYYIFNVSGEIRYDYSDYADFNIGIENYPYNPIYSNFTKKHNLIFNLTKYSSYFEDFAILAFLIDSCDRQIYLGSMEISNNTDYLNEKIYDFTFEDFALYFGNNTGYDSVNSAGIVPSFNYTAPLQNDLPNHYDSRDYGYVTPVKDQLDGGNCWVFSGLATLEACIKKATGLTYDFSEENAKNLMSEFSLWGWDAETNDGGNMYMFMAYLASWFGPILEETDDYDDYSSLSPIYPSILHTQDIITLPNRQNYDDNDIIKKAILDCGAVSVSLKWGDERHAISLIGWDDEYYGYDVFGNFAKGVWIFKNSWGTNWEDNGFSYLSYDYDFYNAYTFIFNQTRGFSHIYQYDFAGVTDTLKFDCNSLYYKNVFTSTKDELLSAVSTYFHDATNYVVSIYLNGQVVSTQTGSSVAGYHIIPLSNEVQLHPGDNFAVEIKVLNSGSNTIPLSQAEYLNQATFNDACSFFSLDGKTWTDLYDYVYSSGGRVHTCQVACIKALARPLSFENLTISINKFNSANINQQVSIKVNVPEYCYLNGLDYFVKGFVTYIINGQYYYAQIDNGQACLNITFDKEGTYNVTAQFLSNYVKSNEASFSFNVVKSSNANVSIFAEDVSKYYGDSQQYVVTLLRDANPISGMYVRLSVGDRHYYLRTDDDGQISYDFQLDPGSYVVSCHYNDITYDSKYVVKSTINVGDTVGQYSNTNLSATFLNSKGRVVDNTQIIFKIGDKEYVGTTDVNGHVNLKIDLNAGNYTVSVTNPLTNEKKQFNLLILKVDSDFSITTKQEGSIITITANSSDESITGFVYIVLGDELNRVDLENGHASLDINNLTPDNYNVSVVYSGDDNFKVSNTNKVFSVKESNIRLNANSLLKYYGGPEQFSVKVTDNGAAVSGVNVKITIGKGVFKNVTDSNGIAHFDVNMDVGEYDVIAEYGGKSISSKVTVQSTIEINNFNVKYGNSNVHATFKDTSGSMIKNMAVEFKVNGQVFGSTTNNQGFATAYIDLNADTYTLIAVNPVTHEQKQARLTISKITPSLSLMLDEFDDKYVLTVNMSSATSQGSMIMNYNGNRYTSEVSNGVSTFTLYVGKASDYAVDVTYTGSVNLNSASASEVYGLNSKADIISAKGFTANYGQNKNLEIKLTNSKGIALSNSKVYYSINGNAKFSQLMTDSNGIARLKCNFKPGTYNIALKSDNYASISLKVAIKKLTSTIKAAKKTFKVKTKTKKYTVTLKLNGKAFKNKKVTLKVKGKTYKAKTNSKGKATFKITKLTKKGSHKAVIKYSGDQYYSKATKTVKIKVKK